MRGMIYRELHIAKKYYIINIAVFLMIMLLEVLVMLSMKYGNLATMEREDFETLDTATYYIFTYLIPVVFFILLNEGSVIISDAKSKWTLFSYATPVSVYKKAGVKFIIKISSLIIALSLSFINAAIVANLNGKSIDKMFVQIIFIIAAITVFVSCLTMPFLIRCKTEKQAGTVGSVIGFIMIGSFYFAMYRLISNLKETVYSDATLQMSEEELEIFFNENSADIILQRVLEIVTSLRDTLSTIAPFVIIGALVGSYFLTVMQMKRREK